MKQVAIVIVTYNSEKDIYDCVQSIDARADIPKEDIELIVVDNCSREPDAMFARLKQQWGEDIVCIKNTKNGGYGQGNNVGIERATAPVVLVMNPDVRLVSPIFQRALSHFGQRPELAVLGFRQIGPTGTLCMNSIACDWLTNGYLHTLISALAVRLNCFLPSRMWVQGSCFFVRKEKFLAIGLFDPTHFMYGEEEDIHYRFVKQFGAKCYAYDSSLSYLHLHAAPAPSFDYERRLVDANVELYQKKGVDPQPILRHYLQNTRLLLCRLKLSRKRDEERYKVLVQLRDYIDSKII